MIAHKSTQIMIIAVKCRYVPFDVSPTLTRSIKKSGVNTPSVLSQTLRTTCALFQAKKN
jgi:hypothetical protein